MDNVTALEITVISAENLKNVRRFGRTMRTYTSVHFWNDNSSAHKSTRVDRDGGSNPTWNEKLRLPLSQGLIHRNGSAVAMEIYCKTTLGKRQVGWTKVPFSDIIGGSYGSTPNSLHFLSYRLRTPNGKPHGIIDLSVRFLQRINQTPSPEPHNSVSNPVRHQISPFQTVNYTDRQNQFRQNGSDFSGCAVGIPISVVQQSQLIYQPQQSGEGEQGIQYLNVKADYHSPVPTVNAYPPPLPYQASQQISYAH